MSTPAPIRVVEYLIDNLRFPVLTVGAVVCFPLLALFVLTGVIYPNHEDSFAARPAEVVGLFLLFSILPAYLLMCLTAWLKSSKDLFAAMELCRSVAESQPINRFRYAAFWPLAGLAGLLFSTESNINWEPLVFVVEEPLFLLSVCMVFGQTLMWVIIALVLFFILQEALVFREYGKQVQIDLYDLDALNGFGRAGLNGLLLVVGALALTALQSLDQVVQWNNYSNAVYIGVPAAILMVFLPIWSVHRNIVREKSRALQHVNTEIKGASASLDAESLTRLNGLLLRRDQIQHLRSWPMDLSIFFRLVLYVFIPPLAWVGAALMEVFLDSFIGA